jgi:hypothetical protein
VARFGERRGAYWGLIGKPERERHHLENLGLVRRMILKLIFNKFYDRVTVHRNNFFLYNKTNRRTNFPNLFC